MKVGHKSRPITVVSRINLTVYPPQTHNYTVRMYFCRLLRPTFMADFHGRLSWPTFMADFGRPTVAVFGRLADRLLQPNRFGWPTLILKSATRPIKYIYPVGTPESLRQSRSVRYEHTFMSTAFCVQYSVGQTSTSSSLRTS
jgi:hypothetical protein